MKSDPMEFSRHHAVNAVASSVEYTIVALEKLRDGDNEMDDIWCFDQHTTNPYSPQDNGMAERAVQTAKRLLELDELEIGLLNYQASPHRAIGVSPAMALMGHQLATRMPVVREQLSPRQHRDMDIRNFDQHAKATYKRCYDRRHGVRK